MAKPIKFLLYLVAAGIVLFVLIQLIPVPQTNPPVSTQVQWDLPQTQALFDQSCANCHSNNTIWPWYSKIAPVSWLVWRDVTEGRDKFNISELSSQTPKRLTRITEEIGKTINEGEMPPSVYFVMHPTANLSDADRQVLAVGMKKTLANFQQIK